MPMSMSMSLEYPRDHRILPRSIFGRAFVRCKRLGDLPDISDKILPKTAIRKIIQFTCPIPTSEVKRQVFVND